MISAIILTYNEENILPKCLEALSFVDEILVFDSFSTDKTLHIAESFNTIIKQRTFDNYSNQRNAALKSINPKSKWILMVDADEIVTEELKNEILKKIILENDVTMYTVRRKDYFNGKWLRFSSGYPTYFPRLFKNRTCEVVREINEEYKTTGSISRLKSHLLHYPFNKGLDWWFQKHNTYSTMESEKIKTEIEESLEISKLFSSNVSERRKFFKRLSFRLPFRPNILFFSFFVLRLGFLDGYNGYIYCRMRKIYDSMINIKFKLKKQ
jgi:glycosyltransferase involved in cell wall biosynthesis